MASACEPCSSSVNTSVVLAISLHKAAFDSRASDEMLEGGATDRFSHREEGHDTVKDAMNKTISESQGRDYVSGFELNHDNAKATPFNPHRMFDHSRVIDRTLDKRKVRFCLDGRNWHGIRLEPAVSSRSTPECCASSSEASPS